MADARTTMVQRGFGRGPRGMIGAPKEKPKDKKKTIGRLLAYFRSERLLVLVLGLVVAVFVGSNVAAPKLQSKAIDLLVGRRFEELPRILVTMLVIYLIGGCATMLQGYLSANLSRNVIAKLRGQLFRHIISLPVSYMDRHSHGDVMSRMTNDAENVSSVISQSLSSLFSGVLMLLGTIIMMFTFSVPLTLLTCLTVVGTVLVSGTLSKLMHKYYLRRQTLLGSLNGTVEEMVTAGRTVTAYNLQEKSIADFCVTSDELTRTGIIAEIIGSSMGPLMNMISNISFVIVSVFGAYFALKGYITVGAISAFIIYSKQFSRPINELAQLYGQIETAMASAERIFAVLDEVPEDRGGELVLEDPKGVIEFSCVNFSYIPEKQVIRDFSLKVEAGKKIALVGATGSGKTTIVNLLMRFYDIDSGEITVDGINIRDLNIESLRDTVGIVLQDTVLFTDTVRNNLKYAENSISDEKMMEAAKLGGADMVVQDLPEGYDTVLTGAGANLSAGQRQLLTIGRAFLSYPRILILDEATSSVDTRTEKAIQDAMVELMRDRTSLIIAHRLSTIRDADLIVVMDQGKIAETGNHDELMEQQGKYYDLYMTQFAGQET